MNFLLILKFISIIPLIVGVFGIFDSIFSYRGSLSSIPGFLLLFVPYFIFSHYHKKLKLNRGLRKKEFEDAIEKEMGAKYVDYPKDSGIALTNNSTLVLSSSTKTSVYTLDKVRSWSKKQPEKEGTTEAYGLSTVGAMQKATNDIGKSIGEAVAESLFTGLAVNVKDVDNPEWFIRMNDDKLISKWCEILRQEVSDKL